jgi:hypothetical protein
VARDDPVAVRDATPLSGGTAVDKMSKVAACGYAVPQSAVIGGALTPA